MRSCGRAGVGTVLLLSAALLVLAACIPSGPTYPVDFFHEMHYTEAYRLGEPPRLAPPDQAVPVTGRGPIVTQAEAANLTNPLTASPDVIAHGEALFKRNCQMCHGATAEGNGIVGAYFQAAGTRVPANLVGDVVKGRTDGQLYASITFGTGELQRGAGVMPPFGHLLASDDIWSLITYIRSLQGQTGP